MDVNYYFHNKRLLNYTLLPIAGCYQLISNIRRRAYRKWFGRTKFPVPIIVIGNITLGGTGKTPLIIWLAQFLKQQGFKPGIVSRGYGGKAKHYPCDVREHAKAHIVGDEPLMIYLRTQCPVIVDPKRTRAVSYLLQQYDCDIVLSDDGMQHYALARDIEIAVIDGERRFGNGWSFPAGPLRERPSRLHEVDFIVSNGIAYENEILMQLKPDACINLKTKEQQPAQLFLNKTIHAVAGIGHPQRFFQSLRDFNLNLIEHAFADHHAFVETDFDFVKPIDIVIMTEKDAVKCFEFATENFWYLPVSADLAGGFGIQVLNKIQQINN